MRRPPRRRYCGAPDISDARRAVETPAAGQALREAARLAACRAAPSTGARRDRRATAEDRHATALPGRPRRASEPARVAPRRVDARCQGRGARAPPALRAAVHPCVVLDRGRRLAVRSRAADGHERAADRQDVRAPCCRTQWSTSAACSTRSTLRSRQTSESERGESSCPPTVRKCSSTSSR
jgi:hypothetical protein